MTQYVTVELLEKRITAERLLNLCGTDSQEEMQIFAGQVLARAQDLAESFLRKCYILPLKEIPPMIQEWILCIAEYELYKRGPASKVPEKIRLSYEDTLNHLRDLGSGAVTLDEKTASPEKNNSSIAIHSPENFLHDPHSIKEF